MKKYLSLLFVSILTIGNFSAFASFPITSNQENVINKGECDNLILKNGDEISAKIFEVTPYLIKYKKCSNLNGPLYSISKSDVMMIRYSDGTKDIIKDVGRNEQERQQTNTQGNQKGVHPLGIVSLACSFTGLFFAGLIFGILGIVFGAITITQKDDKRSKGLGLAGLSLGLIDVIIILAALSVM